MPDLDGLEFAVAQSKLAVGRFIRPHWIGLASLPLIMAFWGKDVLGISIGLSLLAFIGSDIMINRVGPMLAAAGRTGKDLNKPGKPTLPESLGLVVGMVYLVSLFLFLPFPFMNWFGGAPPSESLLFPFQKLGEYTAALLSICSMLFLGFADDVLNLKWRHKVVLPALATLPLLIIYRVTLGETSVVVPIQLRPLLGNFLRLGIFYYFYMACVAIFCTHSINILAGVNGVEVGQSLVICTSLIINSALGILSAPSSPNPSSSLEHNFFALYLLLPFLAVSLALLKHNWWPAQVFVGDTYCYFAGMTFAVVGILGHFSKTLMLFFLPQLINFALSVPQLFGLIPCPRHRLPKLCEQDGRLYPSNVKIDFHSLNVFGQIAIEVSLALGLVKETQAEAQETENQQLTISNFTLLNALLVKFGPMREDKLATMMLLFQSFCCLLGFLIRYHLSSYFF